MKKLYIKISGEIYGENKHIFRQMLTGMLNEKGFSIILNYDPTDTPDYTPMAERNQKINALTKDIIVDITIP